MISTIAVGTDGSPTASTAVKTACGMANALGADLVLLSASTGSKEGPLDRRDATEETQWAFNPTARTREIVARAEEDARRQGISCRTMVDEGDPADVLVRLAGECDADLLVIGNKGMQRRVLGSVPNSVTHNAPCSVLVVKTT
jgi:nucleotide-binding universal stress UspA family protein